MVFINTSPAGFQSQVLRGPIPQVRVLKVEMLDVGHKPFAPQEEVGSSLLITWCCVRGGIYGKCVQPSPPISIRVFSHFPNAEEALSYFLDLPEGAAPCADEHSMCPWEEESSYYILAHPLSFSIILGVSSVN